MITIRELARKSGYSPSTVSAALRNRSDIATETRMKIQQIAEKEGYRVSPKMRELMHQMRSGTIRQGRMSIAIVVPNEKKDLWHKLPWNDELHTGIKVAAGQLGYTTQIIEESLLNRGGEAFQRLIRTRNIRGIIYDGAVKTIAFDCPWLREFPSTVLSTRPWAEPFPAICADFSYNIRTVLSHLSERGYKRIGFASIDFHQEYSENIMESQFYWWQNKERTAADRLPSFIYKWTEASGEIHDAKAWFTKHNPDALIVTDNRWLGWLRQWGIEVPSEVGLTHMNLAEDVAGWSGIDQQRNTMGQLAMETLSGLLDRGQVGSSLPVSIFIRGAWVEGWSTQ